MQALEILVDAAAKGVIGVSSLYVLAFAFHRKELSLVLLDNIDQQRLGGPLHRLDHDLCFGCHRCVSEFERIEA